MRQETETQTERGERGQSFFIVLIVRLMVRERDFGMAHEPLGQSEKAT